MGSEMWFLRNVWDVVAQLVGICIPVSAVSFGGCCRSMDWDIFKLCWLGINYLWIR